VNCPRCDKPVETSHTGRLLEMRGGEPFVVHTPQRCRAIRSGTDTPVWARYRTEHTRRRESAAGGRT